MSSESEEIVMTPTKRGKATHIKIERKPKKAVSQGPDSVVHVAGGEHTGLVITKGTEAEEDFGKPELQIGFMCFLLDQKTNKHFVESRKLQFWYREGTDYYHQVTTAYEFFKELVRPENFPRDYIGFIKKCMKQMQGEKYALAKKVDLEIQQLEEGEAPVDPANRIPVEQFGLPKEDTRPTEQIVREKLLTVLESAYPNVLAVEDLVRITASDEGIVTQQLQDLYQHELVRQMEHGGFVRQVLDTQTEVQVVKQMPTIAANQQPTIAIITALYCEKLAIDAMMENKKTYVKYKTEGESNVYTIGYIGEHKVISTKLPAIGHFRAAQIAAGNTTTRLLGGFQNIEHVFVMGVAGGVSHLTDYFKHLRRGDVLISRCNEKGYIYYYCEKILQDKEENIHYVLKNWAPRDLVLQRIAEKIEDYQKANPDYAPWERYIEEGQELLKEQEAKFSRPPAASDRLYMNIGENQVIEVQHPDVPSGMIHRDDVPRLRYGVVGSGRPVVKHDDTKLDFATKYGISAFDSEFDQVLESIVGNRKDSFMFVRGICDYQDGSRGKEWQPYAALAAAAVVKTIIKSLHNPQLDEQY
ncbi:uncharacterized protein LOC121384991 isoform X2 [Gigantopelta aegis]|uniref:uncharacterized protein LOC121384991 isoform X2 n=1 Tax=Gigantopelta aegis TaxID=1735272 RepID=UPI001B88E126|nr:uncharacterized protein LOC121384991 isoform X2 [Gigantopelta aegis]